MIRIFLLFWVANTILFATQANYQNISQLYVATFNRAPDVKGLDYWVQSALEIENIAKSFFEQPETKKLYPPDTSNSDFIKAVYTNLFNRIADEAGTAYWQEALESGSIDRSVFILAVINGAFGNDAVILQNKQDIGIYFAFYGYNDIGFASSIIDEISVSLESVGRAKGILFAMSGESNESVCINNDFQNNGMVSTTYYIDMPAELCQDTKLENKYQYAFRVRGECISLGYPESSFSTDKSGFSYYHTDGLYHNLHKQKTLYRLTSSPNLKSAQNPCFSPDSQYILYTRFLNGYNIGPSELVKIRIDGSEEKIIVPASDSDNVNVPFGSWVGNQICFASDRGGISEEIWIVNDDGSNLQQITTHSEGNQVYYIEPVFNPKNNRQIVFEYVQDENDAMAIHRIAFLDVNTKNVTLLTDGTYDDRLPSWSNDGSKILFQRNNYGEEEGWSIYIAEINISESAFLENIRVLSYGKGDYTDCSWSFDDKYVLCSTLFDNNPIIPNIWMFPLDLTQTPIQKTFNNDNEDGAPSQSHDGKNIAFESHYGDLEDIPSDIWLIKE